jgi:hypothetical protein
MITVLAYSSLLLLARPHHHSFIMAACITAAAVACYNFIVALVLIIVGWVILTGCCSRLVGPGMVVLIQLQFLVHHKDYTPATKPSQLKPVTHLDCGTRSDNRYTKAKHVPPTQVPSEPFLGAATHFKTADIVIIIRVFFRGMSCR